MIGHLFLLTMKQPVKKGFTLLELLLSLALFLVLLGILWSVVAMFQRTQTRGTRLADRSQLVRSLAQLLEDDLRAAIQDPIHPFAGIEGDDDVRRFGLSGTSQMLRVDVIEINPFSQPEARQAARQPRQTAFGEALDATQDREPKAPELKTVFYHFSNDTGLSRREIDFETPDVHSSGQEADNMLAPEVVDCRFRYFNGSDWSDSWESLEREGLPVAIEATLKLLPLAEAQRVRTKPDEIETTPLMSRIVAYLPTSPVRQFEEYQRKTPPKKEELFPPPPPPPSTLPDIQQPVEPPPLDLAPADPWPTPLPSGPQQSWIRGGN